MVKFEELDTTGKAMELDSRGRTRGYIAAQQQTTSESTAASSATIVFTYALIMIGCCANYFSLEYILYDDPQCGSLVTIAQFSFIALEGFVRHVRVNENFLVGDVKKQVFSLWDLFPFRLKERSQPLYFYCMLVIIFFTQSIINNLVFGYQISMPLHSIFRSGSLVMNILLSYLIFRKTESIRILVCVIVVTAGVIMATMESASKESRVFNKTVEFSNWVTGISLLIVSQIMSALLGIMQEYGYQLFGKKDWRESMFYTHLLSLPFFLFMTGDVATHFSIFWKSPPLQLLGVQLPIPKLIFFLIINMFTQYICIVGVYWLAAITSSLSLTLAITIRKFVSLVVSIAYFGNPFTLLHWASTSLVFGGSAIFAVVKKNEASAGNKEKKQ